MKMGHGLRFFRGSHLLLPSSLFCQRGNLLRLGCLGGGKYMAPSRARLLSYTGLMLIQIAMWSQSFVVVAAFGTGMMSRLPPSTSTARTLAGQVHCKRLMSSSIARLRMSARLRGGTDVFKHGDDDSNLQGERKLADVEGGDVPLAALMSMQERMDLGNRKERRHLCERCLRPARVCVCSVLPPAQHMPVKILTRILILQHPKEFKRKTIGTVPLIKLVLGHGCEVIVSPFTGKKVGQHFNDHPKVLEAAQSGKALLLFPALHPLDPLNKQVTSPVMNLEDKKHEGVWGPDGGTLIVIDGSWSQAKTIFKCTPILHSVPRVQFSTAGLGEYGQLRCEPQETFMSTLESVAHALEILEGSAPGASTGCRAKEALIAVQRELVRHQKSDAIMGTPNPRTLSVPRSQREKHSKPPTKPGDKEDAMFG